MKDKYCNGISGAFPQRNLTSMNVSIPQDNILNYNNILSSVQTYTTLNYIANLMVGIDTRWFRAVPELASKDVIFLEYTLSSVDPDPICVKVVVPNGQFPDAKNSYDLMGLEYDIPLEIQVDFKYWIECAGDGTMPQKGDIVYIPISNKLYEVNSASEIRGFMEQITGYKCNLVKYTPSSSRMFNVDEESDSSLLDTLSKYTASVEELFGQDIKDDIEKITSNSQLSPYLNTSRNDKSVLSKGVNTIIADLYGANTLFAKSYYDFTKVQDDIAIRYDITDNISSDSDRAISAWVKLNKQGRSFDIQELIRIDDNTYNIKMKTLKNISIGDIVNIYKTESLNFGATVVNNINGYYTIKITDYTKNILTELKSNWYDIKGYKIALDSNVNILNSETLSINILNRKIIYIKINDYIYEHVLVKTLENNIWYAFFINMSNNLSKLGINLWTENQVYNLSEESLQLDLLALKSWDLTHLLIDENLKYSIKHSNSNFTNIRIYDTLIVEPNNQVNELLSLYTKHSDKTILIDNADIITNTVYVAENR